MKVAIGIAILLIGSIFAYSPVSVHADDEEFEAAAEDEEPGTVEGTGTHFEVTNSNYLNVILDSSETITLELESAPEMITMRIEQGSASSTSITISGFAPETTYHKYEDSYANHAAFTTDTNGSYTYTQDLSVSHLIFIQPRESTKFITDDATGGDCQDLTDPIGTWDDTNNICTLTTDVTETIEIPDNGITLDCDGHTIDGTGTGSGVFLNGVDNVTVKNCNITDFSDGIMLGSDSNTIEGNTITDSGDDGIDINDSDNNEIEGNTITNSGGDGIELDNSDDNTIYHNTITDSGDDGIELDDSNDNDVTDNNINNSGDDGIFCDDDCNDNTVEGNTIRNSDSDGIFFEDDINDNDILNNIIFDSGGDGIEFDDGENGGDEDNNTIEGNCIINTGSDGIELDDDNEKNTIKNNTIINADDGIDITGENNNDNTIEGNTVINTTSGGIEIEEDSIDNEVFNNNFINTGDPLDDDGNNDFEMPLPVGGNFWSQFNEPSEGCFNTSPADRFCDDPFEFDFNEDDFPYTIPIGSTCYFQDTQPKDPISMNTIRNNGIAKTIHAEKQIFSCFLEQGDIPVIVDITIVAEIYQDMNTQSIIKKDVLAITCVKLPTQGAVLECESSAPTGGIAPVKNCDEFPISHPQEMNTVNKGSIVKTIESQKEVFQCNLDNKGVYDKKVDLVLFTEIWENLNKLPDDPIVKKTFLSFRCVVNLDAAEVESCRFSDITD